METADIAAKIKDVVARDMEALVHRDRKLLTAVCKELELDAGPVNMTQVMVAMTAAKLVTFNEFPKMVYPNGVGQPGVTVNDAAEEKAANKHAKSDHHKADPASDKPHAKADHK